MGDKDQICPGSGANRTTALSEMSVSELVDSILNGSLSIASLVN